jgi:hypothetical protein
MMRQSLSQVLPEPGQVRIDRAGIGEITVTNSGFAVVATRSPAFHGERTTGASVWREPALRAPFRPRAPQASFGQRVAAWRARNWRRAILAWFVLSLAIMAVAAEPEADFPKAQVRSVPAVQVVLHVVGVLTTAGVPLLLITLP